MLSVLMLEIVMSEIRKESVMRQLQRFQSHVFDNSNKYEIPAELINALIMVESSGNPYAMRYEDHYRWLYNVDQIVGSMGLHRDTEVQAQKTSWGLLQVMGAVARELGCKKRFLTYLLDPKIGIEYGCMHLKNLYNRHGSWERAVSAYNFGHVSYAENGKFRNQRYVDRVMEFKYSQ